TPFYFIMIRPPHSSTLFPYTTLFRSPGRRPADPPDQRRARRGRGDDAADRDRPRRLAAGAVRRRTPGPPRGPRWRDGAGRPLPRSEEHTSELQSRSDLVCRLLLEKKK